MDNKNFYLLVVEDIPDILNLLETTLTFKGYRVVTARDGLGALDAIGRERPAVVITDILMPRMDGFSLVHRLRINPETRDIPVIFLSATYVEPEDKAFALHIGVTRFIEKPVNLDELLPTIARLIAEPAQVSADPINELDFYNGYRERLETKLERKNTQIARDEHVLVNLTDVKRPAFEASLRHAIVEREELKHLLDQVRAHMRNMGEA